MPVNNAPVPDVAGQDVAERFTSKVNLPGLNINVQADPDGTPVVVLVIQTQFGPQAYPLDADFAKRIGGLLIEQGQLASTGLSAPPPAASRLIVPGR